MQKSIINHIALQVRDLEESGTFYQVVLGLKPIPEPFKDGLHLWFAMGQNTQLHLIKCPEEPLTLPGRNTHFCFCVKSLEEFMKVLDERQIPYGSWEGEANAPSVRGDGIKQIFFQDPNGYWLEVNNDFT